MSRLPLRLILALATLSTSAFAKPAFSIKLTVDKKPITADKVTIVKDGTICISVDADGKGGIGICVPGDAKAGGSADGTSVAVHRRGAKDLENLIGKGTFHVEWTAVKLGTWKAPGKCSGKLTVAIDDPKVATGAAATAEGTFTDIECYAM